MEVTTIGIDFAKRNPSRPVVHVDCIKRPNRRLHPTNTPDQQIVLAMREPSTDDIDGRVLCDGLK